jgi:hypothetical protein
MEIVSILLLYDLILFHQRPDIASLLKSLMKEDLYYSVNE